MQPQEGGCPFSPAARGNQSPGRFPARAGAGRRGAQEARAEAGSDSLDSQPAIYPLWRARNSEPASGRAVVKGSPNSQPATL